MIVSLLVSLFGSSTWASSPKITMTVPSPNISMQEGTSLQITINGSRSASEPQIENIDDFEIQSQGTSSQLQIINGAMTSSTTYSYLLYPKKSGTFVIGPSKVDVDGKILTSEQIQITVTGTAQRVDATTPYSLSAEVSNIQPFINEALVYTLKFQRRTPVAQAQLQMPEFDGFWHEELGKQVEYEKIVNGVAWTISELKIALFPLAPGTKNIQPARLRGLALSASRRSRSAFDSFFNDPFFGGQSQSKEIRLATQPIDLSVKTLPPYNGPHVFSGLVGSFEIQAEIGKSDLKVGDSVTLTVKISGQGHLRNFSLPEINWPNVKVYDDQPTFTLKTLGAKLLATKIFKKALVPTQAGTLILPPITLTYFDPLSNSYQKAQSQEFHLNVQPGETSNPTLVGSDQQPQQQPKAIKVVGDDIMPIRTTVGWTEKNLNPLENKIILLAAALMILSYLLGLVFQRQRRLDIVNRDQIRSRNALRRLQTQLRSLRNQPTYENVIDSFRGYLGDRLRIDGRSLTSADIPKKLSGVSPKTLENTIYFMQLCETGQYGGSAQQSAEMLLEKLPELAKKLENELPK